MDPYDIEALDEDEEMPATERELAEDAQWKLIQKNTFTRWCNEHLKTVNKVMSDLESDLSDGLRLIALVEVLSGKKFKHINKRPNFRTQKLENVTMSLKFLEKDEGIKIVNIDSTDIVDKKLKLILGLIWTLILHYSISMPMWEGDEPGDGKGKGKEGPTPKQRLLGWIQGKVPDRPINNFTNDWNDGKAIGALVDAVGPGLCPDWEDWDPKDAVKNAKEAMDAAEKWLGVPQLIKPTEMCNPKVDDLSMMTYLSQFPNAKLKPGAPLRPRVNAARVRAYGPGIEPKGNHVGAPARFTVETFSAGRGTVEVIVLNPKGQQEPCEVVFNNDRNLTYSCVYTPTMEGQYVVIIKFSTKEIPKSPFHVNVEGAAGDASKCSAAGPGIEKSGVMATRKTYFEVFTKGAGMGNVEVVIMDPHGHKDTIKPAIVSRAEGTYYVEYTPKEQGIHTVNVFFAGKPIPKSPYTVHVSPPIDPKKCYATGRGIQPKGIRVKDNADFKVHTKGAGEGELKVQVLGPGGKEEPCKIKKIDAWTYECVYTPKTPGNYVINITFSGQHITKSPFKVEVGPFKTTKIRAYGPGLEGGTCGFPADFVVETNGEVGALGFSIEGPSQAKIDCKDNNDGSADVSYWPTAPGEYAVHILCDEEDIPNSPYMAQIQPQTDLYNPTLVSAYGPGLEKDGVVANSWAEFTVDTRKAGRAPLSITAMDRDYNPVEVQVKDNKDGTYSCRYMPKKHIKHTITISYGGCNIPKSPFRVNVKEPSNPSKVKVYGPGVEKGVKTFAKTHFTVDCKEAGPGDVAIALTDERGLDVPVDTKDNGDGTFTITYEPKSVGVYTVSVFFAEQEIPTSPIKVNVEPSIDVSKVTVDGLDEPIWVGEEFEFDIITTGAGKAPATATVTSPKGKKLLCVMEPTVDGFAARFTPTEVGPHKVNVEFGGQKVPGSPFKAEVKQRPKPKPAKPAPAPVGEHPSGKVKVYGDGLTKGQTEKPNEFTIDTREAGPGGLGLTVEGPSESRIECRDNGDGTCLVTYIPTEPGEYTINVTFADQPVKGSPFKPKVTRGKEMLDVSGVFVEGPGIQPTGVFLDSTTDFTVNAKSVTPTGEGKVRAIITNPSGTKNDTLVKNNEDGTYKVSYTPYEQGPHKIDVTYEGLPIPKSPFPVKVVPGCDPTRVRAYGPGLEGGFTNQPQHFTVETRGAGQGGLSLAIEGPSEAKMTCQDNRDGSCSVEYMATKPGTYDIVVKFADKHIPGSPFNVKVDDVIDASRVRAYGPGLENPRATLPATFVCDTSEAGVADLECSYTDKTGQTKPAEIVDNTDGTYSVTYHPLEEGPCKVDVKYNNQAIPGSPFNIPVQPSHDARMVRVDGDGIKSGIPASFPVSFVIDTRDAGIADLEVCIESADGTPVKPSIKDNGDGTYTITYTPEDVGTYVISIKFGGQDVPNAPFKVNTVPVGDASKCKLKDELPKTVLVGEECVITVSAAEAGQGNVTCRIRSPQDTDVDIDIEDNGDGTFTIFYTPHQPGTYQINIKFGGQPVPGGQAEQQAVLTPEELEPVDEGLISPDQVDALNKAKGLYQEVDFCIPVGPVFNFVEAEVKSPSGRRTKPRIVDNKDGTVTIKYQPTELGLHELTIMYNKQPIPGCPFKFHVDAINSGFVTAYGPGLSHGVVNETCDFVINTKDAGAGGLSLAVEGPSKAEIVCKDNKDGTCSVSYVPTAPGEYTVLCKFDGKHISGSPFHAQIVGPGGPEAERATLSVGTSSEVSLAGVDATDIASLSATIVSPSGREEPCLLKRLPNGHLGISFTPREKGEHLVNVFKNGRPIPKSPFKIMVGESELGNAKKVKVTGKGIKEGMANEVNDFVVDTKQAGYGGLSLSIEGPSKADIECQDTPDGNCKVCYKPTEPGTYICNIKFADEHVPGSPFNIKVGGEPSGRIVEKIIKQRQAADVTHVGSQCELSLKVPGTRPLDMQAAVTNPSGVTEMCDIQDMGDSHYRIKFVPKMMGIHTVSVKHQGMHIPGSPFQFTVGPLTDGGSHKVRAAGPGLERGEINMPADFNIYTREAGAGGLSIAIEGPSKAEIDFQDRKDGSCGVSYLTTEPGDYTVSIKFNDQHIPDSPFKVYMSPSSGDAKKVSVQSLQQQGLAVGKPADFSVQFNGARGALEARVVAPSGAEDQAYIREIDQDHYSVSFIPRENGRHYVHVTFDGKHIPGSPFVVLVGKAIDADPGMVQAYGDGLVKGFTGKISRFIVNTQNAGAGALSVTIDGPSKVALNCREVEEGYEFSYTPNAPGDYLITIKYANVHIVGSPFKATVTGQGRASSIMEQSIMKMETVEKVGAGVRMPFAASDANKVSASGGGLKKAFANKKTQFTVDTSQAGQNMLFVGVMGPIGAAPCDEINIKHQSHNVYTVSYTVKEKGQYYLMVKWGEQHIPGSPFTIDVV